MLANVKLYRLDFNPIRRGDLQTLSFTPASPETKSRLLTKCGSSHTDVILDEKDLRLNLASGVGIVLHVLLVQLLHP